MERIIVIGNCGSGKSTLSKQLSEITGLPLIHLDVISRGQGYWESLPREEFDKILLNELQKPQWIIDGNFNRTIPMRLLYCDTVIFFDFPRIICLHGVLKRLKKYHGTTRPDMGGNCPERFDLHFLKFVWNFNKKHRKRYYEMLEKSKADVIILKSRKDVSEFLEKLQKEKQNVN